MANRLDPVLTQLHRRILAAIGAPSVVVGLSLAGCAPDEEAASAPRVATPDPGGRAPAAAAPSRLDDALVAAGIAFAPPPRPPEVYETLVEVLGSFVPGHVVEVTVRDVPAGASVALFLGQAAEPAANGLSLAAPELLAEAFAGSDGEARLRFLVPADQRVGTFQLQAAADDGEARRFSAVSDVQVTVVAADFPGPSELHPLTADEDLVPGAVFRACVPEAEYGVCPAIADFHDWQALEVVAYALDRPLAAEVSALACLEETAFVGDCCYVVELWDTVNGSAADACVPPEPEAPPPPPGGGGGWGWEAGRPFVVGADARRADVRPADGWCAPVAFARVPEDPRIRGRVVQAWIRTAQAEHGSVASFGRLVLELLALGAPADLVARATRAQADEIRHARDAFGVASALAGEPLAPGALAIDGALGRSAREILVSAIVEGCVNETVCAVQVLEASRRAADPAVARLLAATAEDELRHAELSWALVRWLLERHPELAGAAREAFAAFDLGPAPAADPDADALAAWGVLSDRDLHAVAVDVVARVVVPAARTLLDAAGARAADAACC